MNELAVRSFTGLRAGPEVFVNAESLANLAGILLAVHDADRVALHRAELVKPRLVPEEGTRLAPRDLAETVDRVARHRGHVLERTGRSLPGLRLAGH